jgi:protein-S-isoprenylcysteine O-methyltransferase Ste14
MESLKQWVTKHPNLTAWFVLALGMVILLLAEARDVGLEASQWFWLIVITILVAGAAIWIISWGDDEESATVEDDNQAEISS